MSGTLRALLKAGGAFQSYAYAYPHKTAYRRLAKPRSLAEVWEREDKQSLFLYAHVPFCEMRCGFCNLFTTTHPGGDLVRQYLDALAVQAEVVAASLGESARMARWAIGGGTPTFLSLAELQRLFEILRSFFRGATDHLPRAIEASPATVDAAKLEFLREQGVTRMSLGVQSLIPAELRTLGRSQPVGELQRALELLSAVGFPCLNLDLIYGIPGQTLASWRQSLVGVLEFSPQELYLYPLYVRPLTQLDGKAWQSPDERLVFYRAGRDYLLAQGYRQISLRLFRRDSYAAPEGPIYCCQEDGLVGLGAGARSYTAALHYSTEFAVGRSGILEVIRDFNQRGRADFAQADYGFELDLSEQKRRYLLKSLLRAEGLDGPAYAAFFGRSPAADFPQLQELVDEQLAEELDGCLRLNARGLEVSDVLGPWLASPVVRAKMARFELR